LQVLTVEDTRITDIERIEKSFVLEIVGIALTYLVGVFTQIGQSNSNKKTWK